ncbi:MAG: signal transduction histidine kinase [Rhodocyclaceae bacterium]|nr:signal transduction histidine kinase [Rhodocyclaceae bacterium]
MLSPAHLPGLPPDAMKPCLPASAIPGPFKEWPLLLLGNTLVAAFLTVATEFGFLTSLVYSCCIGLAIGLVSSLSCVLGKRKSMAWRDLAAGVLIGGLGGFVLGAYLNGHVSQALWRLNQQALAVGLASALTFGLLISLIFYHRMRAFELAAQVQEERLRQAEHEKRLEQARLQVLQARIEPHFLFNTLSNILSLIDSRPEGAKSMLLNLTDLLRGHLSPEETTTLGRELDLLRAYLGIMEIRMGPRLSWRIDAPPEVLDSPLPPFLLQPLVENALRHGLEPKPEGGRLTIACARQGQALEIVIADEGLGLERPSAHPGAGQGMANVRERLAHAFGPAAGLELAANRAGGATCRLTLPQEVPCGS